MGSDTEWQENHSDNETDSKTLNQFVESIVTLNKKAQLKKASRSEPSLKVSEYNLVKSITGDKGKIKEGELSKLLKVVKPSKKSKQVVLDAKRKIKTLAKPVERPIAERIKQSIVQKKVSTELCRWDAVVTSNRAANHLSFPLEKNLTLSNETRGVVEFRLKSDLEKALEAIEPQVEMPNSDDTSSKFPLTKQEILERRKEMAQLRAKQSYIEAKARRQGRIKSKKYHRLQKKAKTKQQLKEFEKLQETNPEEALKKLDEIERVRAQERASLRHKNTGKWAKNKQILAKYDKNSRQALAQQLAVSRELTQKLKKSNLDSDEEEDDEDLMDTEASQSNNNENNPWTNSVQPPGEFGEFISGYKKYWEENNKVVNNEDGNVEKETEPIIEAVVEYENITPTAVETVLPNKKIVEVVCKKEITSKTHKKKVKFGKLIVGTSEWIVTPLIDNNKVNLEQSKHPKDIDSIFEKLEKNVKNDIRSKYKELKKDLTKDKCKVAKRKTKKRKLVKTDLSMEPERKRAIIDEELVEETQNDETDKIENLKLLLSNNTARKVDTSKTNLNLSTVIRTNPVNLETQIPSYISYDDNEEGDDEQRGAISEAFKDDDVVDDFKKDKAQEVKDALPQDVNKVLPGWGSWGGVGIKVSKRKNKRFITKFPKKVKRRDDNQGNLIINEKANKKIKPHMVSEVPFPFKTVDDYEASIRAPISDTFVPQVAYKKFIQPVLETQLGTVIEPMTDDVLLKKNQK